MFRPASTLNVDEFEKDLLRVYDTGENSLVIDNINGLNINTIDIYNVLGQHLLRIESEKLDQNKTFIPFDKTPGLYLINIQSDKGERTYKILKR